MRSSAIQFTPQWTVRPGEHLRECIESRRLSVEEFGNVTDIPVATVDALIAGTHPITLDIALRIESSFGIMPELWFLLQAKRAQSGL